MIKILVVDDSEASRTSLTFGLTTRKHHVVSAINGSDAISKIRDNNDLNLVITDLNMPEVDGFGLINHIRKRSEIKTIPIIVLSVNREMGEEALEKGANAFIIKSSKASEEISRFIEKYIINSN